MLQCSLEFDVEVVDEQRHLNGMRYIWIEGCASEGAGSWTLALNYGRPKDEESSLEEGDAAITGPNGSIFAGLESGRADIVNDEVSGDERELLSLALRVSGGDGKYAGVTGSALIRGELAGVEGRLTAELSVETLAC
jgi:hypothetical protein